MSENLSKPGFVALIEAVRQEMESWPDWKKGDYSQCPRIGELAARYSEPSGDVGELIERLWERTGQLRRASRQEGLEEGQRTYTWGVSEDFCKAAVALTDALAELSRLSKRVEELERDFIRSLENIVWLYKGQVKTRESELLRLQERIEELERTVQLRTQMFNEAAHAYGFHPMTEQEEVIDAAQEVKPK